MCLFDPVDVNEKVQLKVRLQPEACVRTPVYTFKQIDSTDYNLILNLKRVTRFGQID